MPSTNREAVDQDRIPYYQDDAVRESVARILSQRYGHDVRITRYLREDIRYAPDRPYGGVIVSRLTIELDPRDETTVIIKQFIYAPSSDSTEMTRRRDYVREQELIYRLYSTVKAVPELYGAVCDPERGRYWLFMEDLGRRLRSASEDFGREELPHIVGFMDRLSELHRVCYENSSELESALRAALASRPGTKSPADWRDACLTALAEAPQNLVRLIERGSMGYLRDYAEPFAALSERCFALVEALKTGVFIYGHADKAPEENFIIGEEGKVPRYVFIDWDEVSCLPALEDASGLIWHERSESDERVLIGRYWERLRDTPLVPADWEDCFRLYRQYRLMEVYQLTHFFTEIMLRRQGSPVAESHPVLERIPVGIRIAKELGMLR